MMQKRTVRIYWMLSLSLLLFLALLCLVAVSYARDIPFDDGTAIDADFDGAFDVFAADIDSDGDLDVLGAAATEDDITWWENTEGDASVWISDTIDGAFAGARSVHAADMDGDGDLDVLGAAVDANEIAWWENGNGDGSTWDKHSVDAVFGGAHDVYAADVDGDGDVDVMGAAYDDDDFAWWENTGPCTGAGGACTSWTEHNVTDSYNGAHSVYAADMDGDGDLDMLVAVYSANDIAWYENTAGDGSTWTWHGVDTALAGAREAYAADMDGDGDLDVVGTGWNDADIAWWENTAGDGTTWTEHPVKLNWDGAYGVHAADMDGDGDMDLLGTANVAAEISWWENNGPCTGAQGSCATWPQRTLETEFYGANTVYAADVDGDGDLDVLGTGNIIDDIAWWENETIHRTATYPVEGKHTVDAPDASTVHSADVDGDGDLDVLGATAVEGIAWWENTDGDGIEWMEHAVHTSHVGTFSAFAADMDGDGDLDVVGADSNADDITWWENDGPCTGTGGACSTWMQHAVDTDFGGANEVYAADMDGDSDLDVLGAGGSDIAWWENTGPCTGTGGACSAWLEHAVDASSGGQGLVYAADMDSDGDLDVLGEGGDGIAWWENAGPCTGPDGACSAWTEHVVDTHFVHARDLYAADLDGDGDLDVLLADYAPDPFGPVGESGAIAWWENTGPCSGPGGACSTWTEHQVDMRDEGALSVFAADLDSDGDLDVLGGGKMHSGDSDPKNAMQALDELGGDWEYDDIAWWENTGACTGTDGACSAWTEHTVGASGQGGPSVHAADLDGDGDLDVLGVSSSASDTAWWENRGGQFALATIDTALASMNPGTENDVLAIEVAHRGRSGDGDLELVSLELLFEGCYGDDCTLANLTSAQADELFDGLRVYKDDGNGSYGGYKSLDILVATVTDLKLSGGVLNVKFSDGDALLKVAQGTPRTYFVVLDRVDSAPHNPTVDRFTITHITEASSTAEDRAHDIGLTLEYAANAASRLIFDNDAKVCEPVSYVWIGRVPAGALFTDSIIQFTAQVFGSTPLTYEWLVDGAQTFEEGSTLLTGFSVAGKLYHVRVRVDNACGQGVAEMEVVVRDAIYEQPDLSSSQKTVNLTTVESGDVLTYTLVLRNNNLVEATATLTDPIPINTTYVADSASASDGGVVTHGDGQLHWSGAITNSTPVLIEYAVELQAAPVGTLVTNTAYLGDGYGNLTVLEARSTYNPGYRLSINDGALYTNIPTVTLGYLWNIGDEITHVKFSNDAGFGPAGDTTDWLPVDAQDTLYEDWVLATYKDLRMPCIVSAVFRDLGGIQYGPLQDNIVHDPDAPDIVDVDVVGGSTLATMSALGRVVTVRVTASDDNSGPAEVHLSHNPDFDPYSNFAIIGAVTDIPWDPQGSEKVHVRVIDRAGNASEIESVLVAVEYRVYLPMALK